MEYPKSFVRRVAGWLLVQAAETQQVWAAHLPVCTIACEESLGTHTCPKGRTQVVQGVDP